MIRTVALALAGLIPACQSDKAYSGDGIVGPVWTLIEQNGTPFSARASLTFGDDGQISGQAPCNRFTTTNTLALPGFAPGATAATRMACPDLAAESAFFETLNAMTVAEVSGDALILRNDSGVEMVFTTSE